MDKCYLCSSTENLTKDHVPPQNLFPPPKPSNLITINCCNTCNNSFAMDDEAFRIFVASGINRSAAGDWAWKEGVVRKSFARSPKLKENVSKSLIRIDQETLSGTVTLHGLTFPGDRGERYLIRLTKGLTSHFYPEINYYESLFTVDPIAITQSLLENSLVHLEYDERGDCVFRFWRTQITDDVGIELVWVYVFYDDLAFIVKSNGLSIDETI